MCEVRVPNFWARPKNIDHAPHLRVLEDSWLIKKAVLGLVAIRKRHLRIKFQRPVSLLLVGAASYHLSLTIFVTARAEVGAQAP